MKTRYLLLALGVLGAAAPAAQAWWISTGFDYNRWQSARDGHEWITAQAIARIRAKGRISVSDAEARDILFGVRDNDQAESSLLPFGGKHARHVADAAQRTHSMLPGTFEYLGRRGFERAAAEARDYVVWAVAKGLTSYSGLPESTTECLKRCGRSASCRKECERKAGVGNEGWAAGSTRLGKYEACKREHCARYRSRGAGSERACISKPPANIEKACREAAQGWVDRGGGRPVARDRKDEIAGMPGDATRYTGLRWVGKGLHALQDSYSCAHADRRGAVLCELFAYQGVCTPGGSKLHVSIDAGDNTHGFCAGNARAAIDATVSVLEAFFAARDRVRAGARPGAEQGRIASAVGAYYRTGSCYAGPRYRTWNELYAREKKMTRDITDERGRPLKILTWTDLSRMNPASRSADRDRLRKERDLICGVETGSDRLAQFLDLQWERLGERCDEMPDIALGKDGEYGKLGEYFRENWPCTSDAVLYYWLKGVDEYESLKRLTMEGKEDFKRVRDRLKNLWKNMVCANWKRLGNLLRRVQREWEAANRKIAAIQDQIDGIMACTGAGEAVDFVRGRIEDARMHWSQFKEKLNEYKLRLKEGLRTRASKAFELVVGAKNAAWIRGKMKNLQDWWQNTCLVEEGGFFPTKIAPLLAAPARFLAKVLGPSAERAYARMKEAAAWAAGAARRLGSGLWSRASEFVSKYGSDLYEVLKTYAGKAADRVAGGARTAKTYLCRVSGPMRDKVHQALAWLRDKVDRVVDTGKKIVDTAKKKGEEALKKADAYLQEKLRVIRTYGEAAWDFVQKHGRKAYDALRQFGRDAAEAFKKYGSQILSNVGEYVNRTRAAISDAAKKMADDARRVAEETRRLYEEGKKKAAELADKAKETAKKVFDAVGYGGCLIKACASSPRQCYRGSGPDFNRDVGSCDSRYGYDSSVAFSKARFLSCMGSWALKGLTPFSGVGIADIPTKIRENCY